jgi:hypothetical protein
MVYYFVLPPLHGSVLPPRKDRTSTLRRLAKMLNLRTDSYGNKLTELGGSDWLVVIVFAPVIHGGVVQLIFSRTPTKRVLNVRTAHIAGKHKVS